MISESLQSLMANLRAFGVGVATLEDLKAWTWDGRAEPDWKDKVRRAWCDALTIEPPPQEEIPGHQKGLRYWKNRQLGERVFVSFYWADLGPTSKPDWHSLA